MIVDTTQTKIERDLNIAHVQAQLAQIVNDPNLTFISELVFDYDTGELYSRIRCTPAIEVRIEELETELDNFFSRRRG
ncbi:MAG: hypothetical protein ACXAC5_03310 [Promethearchaeota archaeon]|jgi:hypothetical protein